MAASGQPAAVAKSAPAVSALASVWLVQLPLWMTAASKSPRAGGDASSAHTAKPPADSPAMATRPGSPPKAAMLARVQRSAACWSSRP